jgi:hypothetical protein
MRETHPHSGAELRPSAKFCDECGSLVAVSGMPAEYKQVTVLFADVVHSMDIAAAVGAERLREIMADLGHPCGSGGAALRRHGGQVHRRRHHGHLWCARRLICVDSQTYRFLAAHAWAVTENAALQRISPTTADIITEIDQAPAQPAPSTAEVRAWARSVGLEVPDRGRLRPEIWQAWHDANALNQT